MTQIQTSPPPVEADSSPGFARAIALAVLGHALLWSLLPPLFVGNLHIDTAEAASWATHWAFGYAKHPPLVVWLFNLVLASPGPRIVNFLLLSQVGVAISAFFIWKAVRLYGPPRLAAVAVIIYVESASATYFAMQVNHNSLSVPFGAAVFYFGLRYLELRQTRDIAGLAIVSGLALLTKYEVAFFHIALLAMTILVPRFRFAWRDPRAYVGVLVAALIFAPHVWWDYQHHWTTMLYATADRPMRGLGDVGESANQLLDGLLMTALGPLLAWLILGWPRLTRERGDVARLGLMVATAPILAMIVLGVATDQILRQGWLVPLIPGVAVGASLLFASRLGLSGPAPTALAWRTIALSAGQVLVFALFLFCRAVTGSPVEAYSLDSEILSVNVEAFWGNHGSGPMPCLLAPNRTFGLATMFHLHPPPRVADLDFAHFDLAVSLGFCRETGGLVITPENYPVHGDLDRAGLPSALLKAPTWPRVGAFDWGFYIYYIPPAK